MFFEISEYTVMKRFFLIITLPLMFIACNKDGSTEQNGYGEYEIFTSLDLPEDSNTIYVSPSEGKIEFMATVPCECVWTNSSNWCKINSGTLYAGSNIVSITINKNTDTEKSRTAQLTLKDSYTNSRVILSLNIEQLGTFDVSCDGAKAVYAAAYETDFSDMLRTFNISIAPEGYNYVVQCPDAIVYDNTVIFKANKSESSRTIIVEVKAKIGGRIIDNICKTFEFGQNGLSFNQDLDNTLLVDLSAKNESVREFHINCRYAWKLENGASDWLKIVDENNEEVTSGVGTTNLRAITIGDHKSSQKFDKNQEIKVHLLQDESVYKAYATNRSAALFDVTPSFDFTTNEAGSAEIAVNCDFDWSVAIADAENNPWIKKVEKINDTTFVVEVEANTTEAERQADIYVDCDGYNDGADPGLRKIVTIKQPL